MDVTLSGRALITERPTPRHVDGTLALAALALTAFGLLMVYSATNRSLSEFGHGSARLTAFAPPHNVKNCIPY